MNRKGFTLFELLGCLVILAVILGIGLYSTRGTLATTLSTLTDVSRKEIYDAAKTYILENKITWTNDGEEYTCLPVDNLVDAGYFEESEVTTYKNNIIRIVRDAKTRVVDEIELVSECN